MASFPFPQSSRSSSAQTACALGFEDFGERKEGGADQMAASGPLPKLVAPSGKPQEFPGEIPGGKSCRQLMVRRGGQGHRPIELTIC